MAADERSGPASRLIPSAGSDSIAGATQTASFSVGSLDLALSAAPGAARLVVTSPRDRDIYVVDPSALEAWATSTHRLLSLTPAQSGGETVEFRAPYLVDREGRASVAFEAHVGTDAVTYRLLVSGASSRVAGLMTTAELVRSLVEAAAGAVAVARLTPG